MESLIIADIEIAKKISDDLMGRRFPGSGRPIFKRRENAGFGYEIYARKIDKTEMVVFRLSKTGPGKFPHIKMEWDDKILTVER